MTDVKPWLTSRAIWGGIIAFLTPLLGLMGFAVTDADQHQLVEIGIALGGAVAGVLAIWGRVGATKRIGKPKARVSAVLLVMVLAAAGPIACSHLDSPYTGSTPQQQVLAFKGYVTPVINAAAVYLEQGGPDPGTKALVKDAVIAIRDGVAKAEIAAADGDDPGVAAAIEAARHAAGLVVPILQKKGLLP